MYIMRERLKALREEYHLSQLEFGKLFGVSRPTIVNYERGKNSPDINFIIKVGDYFDVSIDYLVGKSYNRKSAGYKADYVDTTEKMIGISNKIEKMPQPETIIMFQNLSQVMDKIIESDSAEHFVNLMTVIFNKIETILDDYTEKDENIKYLCDCFTENKLDREPLKYMLNLNANINKSSLNAISVINTNFYSINEIMEENLRKKAEETLWFLINTMDR